MQELEEFQLATNETVLKMIDTYTSMYKKMYKLTITIVICVTIILTSLLCGVLYFLSNFEVEASVTETHQTIEGDGRINNIDGDGIINNIDTTGDVQIGGRR